MEGNRDMKVKKKVMSLLIAAVMIIGMLPMGAVTVMADGDIEYQYYDNGTWYDGTKYSSEYTVVDSNTTSWNAGWYVVKDTVTISGRITVNGEVNLILADTGSLTASSGITVSGNSNSLTIYGQENNFGKLTANASSNSAGIGGTNGASGNNITINGGTITATGNWGAGIGGGHGGAGSNITINGGTVTATAGSGGAGIGGGDSGEGNYIYINGGTVTAIGDAGGAGIGGGGYYNKATGSKIYITGGIVNATGGSNGGAGIGGGENKAGTEIEISGGYITATGGGNQDGVGDSIGSGRNTSETSSITITGGYYASDSSNSTVGASGTVYDVTVANNYSVCNNTENESKADYPYVVMLSSGTVTSEWISASETILKEVVASGSEVSQPANPSNYSDDDCTYTFKEWDQTFVQYPTESKTYKAVFTATYKAPAKEEGYTISYTNETATAETGYEISTDGETWSSGSITITPGGTLYVYRPTDSTASASEVTTNTLASRLDTPTNVSGVSEVWEGDNDGQITGVSDEMEYQADGDTSWTSCTGTIIDNLGAGTYYVRYAATSSNFASDAVTITLESGTVRTYILTVTAPTFDTVIYGYDQPEAKSITIENRGNSDATIESITVDPDDFIIDGSGNTVSANGGTIDTWTIRPKAGLSGGTHTSTITVTYNNTTATATVTFVVTPTYTLTVVLDGGSGDTDGGVYEEDTVVNIDAGSRSNYTFTGWTSSDGGTFGDASSASTTFTMPASDTTITAN